MDLDQLFNDVAKIQGDMAAYQKEYPVPIAISVSRRGYAILKDNFSPKPKSQAIPFEPLAPPTPFGSMRVYVWDKQPELFKAYYDREEFKRWFEAYANPGDVMILS